MWLFIYALTSTYVTMLKISDNIGYPDLILDFRRACELKISLSMTYSRFFINILYFFKKVLFIVYYVLYTVYIYITVLTVLNFSPHPSILHL